MQEVLRHLIHGWQGFVRIAVDLTNQGVVLRDDDLHRLEKAQRDLASVIEKQKTGR